MENIKNRIITDKEVQQLLHPIIPYDIQLYRRAFVFQEFWEQLNTVQ